MKHPAIPCLIACLLISGCSLGTQHGYCTSRYYTQPGEEPSFLDSNPIKSFFCWVGGVKQEASYVRSTTEYMIFDDPPRYTIQQKPGYNAYGAPSPTPLLPSQAPVRPPRGHESFPPQAQPNSIY